MSISLETRLLVRQRANFACEYCGVSETNTGGELNIDHYHPRRYNGADTEENLLYACQRCNLYKADYWPSATNEPQLWNPRRDPRESHMLALVDGTLYPLTKIGMFTVQRLRLNRPPLIAHRLHQLARLGESFQLEQFSAILTLLDQLQQQHVALLNEQRSLIEEQRRLLLFLLRDEENEDV